MAVEVNHAPDSVFVSKSQKGYLARTSLMDAAVELVAKKGVSSFSINELCEKAGLRRTSFYTYFDSVEDLVSQVSQREDSEFDDRLKREFPDLTFGLLRLTLNIGEFFEMAQGDAVWNAFVVELLTNHPATHEAMKQDVQTDVEHAVTAGELDLTSKQIPVFTGLTISSLFVATSLKERGLLNPNTTIDILEMLLRAGKASSRLRQEILDMHVARARKEPPS